MMAVNNVVRNQSLPGLQIARQKKREQKEREQLFDVEEDEEEEQEEDERDRRGSSKRSGKGRRGGADSDSDDEDKDAGVWADNEAEAMLGPGDEAKVLCRRQIPETEYRRICRAGLVRQRLELRYARVALFGKCGGPKHRHSLCTIFSQIALEYSAATMRQTGRALRFLFLILTMLTTAV